jgi:ABC-type dipeptide/oligopeptide/nickel transport system permease subunit
MRRLAGSLPPLLIALLAGVALLAPWIAPQDPLSQNVFLREEGPSAEHWLGTDQLGRDVFSRLLHGARLSLAVGVFSPLLAAFAGIAMGMAAGYFGGAMDRLVVRITDTMMAFDPLLLGVLVVAVLGPNVVNLAIAIAAALTPQFIRLARAQTLVVRQEAYVEAAIVAGSGWVTILRAHVLPNIAGPLIVMGTLWIATAIRLEASLSFIGLGAQAPTPSWGNMVRESITDIFGSPLPAICAGAAITLTILGFNLLGERLRDRLDPGTR